MGKNVAAGHMGGHTSLGRCIQLLAPAAGAPPAHAGAPEAALPAARRDGVRTASARLRARPSAGRDARRCGAQVRGDAFLARVRDNEREFERLDFTLGEVASSAAWVKARAARTAAPWPRL